MKLRDLAIKGFNAGYMIEKFNPQLSDSLSTGIKESNSPFVLGFLLGRMKLLREQEKTTIVKRKDIDLNRRMDDLELE
ncbi:MAG: hypothetical protein H6571_21780 [Lewinellaceae bacterium]|nr:hypothetical protein [Lewinellaceae bacterium]